MIILIILMIITMETFCIAQKVWQSLLLFQIPNPTLSTLQPGRGAVGEGGDWLIERPKPCKTHSPGDGCKRFEPNSPDSNRPSARSEVGGGVGGPISSLSQQGKKKKK